MGASLALPVPFSSLNLCNCTASSPSSSFNALFMLLLRTRTQKDPGRGAERARRRLDRRTLLSVLESNSTPRWTSQSLLFSSSRSPEPFPTSFSSPSRTSRMEDAAAYDLSYASKPIRPSSIPHLTPFQLALCPGHSPIEHKRSDPSAQPRTNGVNVAPVSLPTSITLSKEDTGMGYVQSESGARHEVCITMSCKVIIQSVVVPHS